MSNPTHYKHNQRILQEFDIHNPLISEEINNNIKQNEDLKMVKLSDEAKNYEAPKTKVISDLEQVPTNLDIFVKEGVRKDGETFTYKYVEIGGEEYRVPNIVLSQLKTHLENTPDLQLIKVDKQGEGLKTVYTVIPIK